MVIGDRQIETFQLINHQGAERIRFSLAEFTGEKVAINPIKVCVQSLDGFSRDVADRRRKTMAIHVKVNGDIEGEILFILSRRSAVRFAREMLKDHAGFNIHLRPLEQSALCEVANILSNAYILAFADCTALSWKVTVPHLCTNLNKFFELSGRLFNLSSVVLSAEMHFLEKDIQCTFALIARKESFGRLLEGLGGMH
ncbi:MAG: hypothetical protein ACM3WV_00370 [Bacillota bacterium]